MIVRWTGKSRKEEPVSIEQRREELFETIDSHISAYFKKGYHIETTQVGHLNYKVTSNHLDIEISITDDSKFKVQFGTETPVMKESAEDVCVLLSSRLEKFIKPSLSHRAPAP